MKKKYLLVVMIIIMIILSSCSIEEVDSSNKIVAPNNNILPLEGKWTVEKVMNSPNRKIKEEINGSHINKEILFHNHGLVVENQYLLEPSYNIKNVKLSDYLLYKFKIGIEYLGIKDGEVEIIRVMGNDQCFYEFIKYKEDEMIILIEEQFFFLKKKEKKVSEEEFNRHINLEKNISKASNIKKLETLNTGLLLGVKTYEYDEKYEIDDWKYKTIWIKSNDRAVSSVYEMEKLLLPRKKGFWLIDVERESKNDVFTDKIKFIPETIVNNGKKLNSIEKNNEVDNQSIFKNILYLGNDYISTEVVYDSTNKKTLEFYPLDNMEKGIPTILSDIVNEKDIKINLKDNGKNSLNYSNFGLVRRNGYWIMKGRENYNKENKEIYEDYNIKIIPPKEIVGYDNLPITWSRIKEKFPSAYDAFISPNEDIIIIDTRKELLIYPFEDNKILEEELGKIKKNSTDIIIMAEWSTGIYTNLWEEEVLKNHGKHLDYN